VIAYLFLLLLFLKKTKRLIMDANRSEPFQDKMTKSVLPLEYNRKKDLFQDLKQQKLE